MPYAKRTSSASKHEEVELTKALRSLQASIEHVPIKYSHLANPGKHLLYTYAKGIVYGLGALTAVAIIIPLIVAMLQRVPWSPLVSNFVQDVIQRMDQKK